MLKKGEGFYLQSLGLFKKIVSEKVQIYSYKDGRFGLLKKADILSFFFVNTDFIDFKGFNTGFCFYQKQKNTRLCSLQII